MMFIYVSLEKNDYTKESINCLNRVITKKNINLFISTTFDIYKDIIFN